MTLEIQNEYVPPLDTGDLSKPLNEPTFGEAFRATFAYQYMPLLDHVEEQSKFAYREFDPAFDPFANMSGYEAYASELAGAKDMEHLNFIKENIDRRNNEKDVLDRAGFWSGGMWVASLVDPLNIAFALPVFGQLGLMAKGGMTVRQAAAASFRGGLATAAVSEGIRAPFDRTNTMTETGLNLAATTAMSTIFGSIPSLARAGYNSARKSAAMRDALYQNRGILPEKIGDISVTSGALDRRIPVPRDVTITVGPTGKTVRGRYVPAKYNNQTRSIVIDEEYLASQFDSKPWTKPRMAGVRPLPSARFKTPQDWVNFVRDHEILHSIYRPEDFGFDPKLQKADYENAINDIALGDSYRKSVDYDWRRKKITIDEDYLVREFDKRPWINPEVEGAKAFKQHDFNTPQEWGDFQAMRHIVRRENKRQRGESKIAYIDRTNKMALDRARTGYELAETPLTKSFAYKMLTTPGKRILSDGTNSMKRFYHLLAGVDHMSIKRLADGKSNHQSIDRMAARHLQEYVVHRNKMEELWTQDQLGRSKATRIFGYNTDDIVAKWQNAKTFEDWYVAVTDARFLEATGGLSPYNSQFSKHFRQAMREQEGFYKKYKNQLEELGLLRDDSGLQAIKRKVTAEIKMLEDKQAQVGLGDFQQRRLDRQRDYLIRVQEMMDNRLTERYLLPIYYDKAKIRGSEDVRRALVDKFEAHIRNNPINKVWDERQGRFVEIPEEERRNPRISAEKAVESILQEGDPFFVQDVAGVPKGKHLRHRQLDIPEHEISDFIIKDSRVARSYAGRVGKRIEWARNFGDQSIDDVLNDFEVEMRDAGFNEKKIQALREDMAFEYERVMGEHIKNPDRWDAQFGKALKEMAGMSYLDTAALASVTDMGNMILERGFLNTFAPLRTELDRGLRKQAKAMVNSRVYRTELQLGGVQQRLISDNVDKLSDNLVERVMNPITRAYYNIPVLGNGLGSLTYWFKGIDAVDRSHFYMDQLIKWSNNSIKEADARYLMRMGFTEQDAKIISKYPHQTGDNYIFANVDKWPQATKADRDILRKWDTAMNAGISNTILHATSFDKPRIMDGVAYVNYRPWMSKIGLEIDTRASTANIKVARIETQALTMPFQFFNFMLGATNRITAGMFDPMKRHRVTGAIALMGLGYTALHLKHLGQPWWFDKRSEAEILQRTIDQSGLFGVYAEIGYQATHAAIGLGLAGPDDTWLRPKYNPTMEDTFLEPFGAAPGMVYSWIKAAQAYFNGDESEAAKQFGYNFPTTPLFGLAKDWLD